MGKIAIPIIPRPDKNKDNSSDMFQYIGNEDGQYAVGDLIIAVEKQFQGTVIGEIVEITERKNFYTIYHVKPVEFSPDGQKIDSGDTLYTLNSNYYTFTKTTKKDYIDSVKTTLEDNIKKTKEEIRHLHKDILTYQKNLREIKKIK